MKPISSEQPGSGKDENVSEAMSNAIISQLRGRYLDLLNREADYSFKYGKNHQAALNLRNQIRDIRRSIRDELGRIEETFKSEYQLAKQQQDEAEKALAGLVSQSTDDKSGASRAFQSRGRRPELSQTVRQLLAATYSDSSGAIVANHRCAHDFVRQRCQV